MLAVSMYVFTSNLGANLVGMESCACLKLSGPEVEPPSGVFMSFGGRFGCSYCCNQDMHVIAKKKGKQNLMLRFCQRNMNDARSRVITIRLSRHVYL